MRKQFAKTVMDLADTDERLTLLLGDISVYLFRDLFQSHPDRAYNIGICEQAMMSMAAGLSSTGLIPVVHSIAPFLIERCYEQIKVGLCYQQLGAKLVGVGSAFDYGPDGCTHHCYEDFAILRALPGMEVLYPASPMEFDLLFRQTYDNGRPGYFRIPSATHGVQWKPDEILFGKGVTVQTGSQATVVVCGPQLRNVVEVCEDGDVDVLYIHTIKPLDEALIQESVLKTGRVLVIEEHNEIGGLGDAVSHALQGIPHRACRRLGIRDKFLTRYGTYDENCEAEGLSVKGIRQAVMDLVQGGQT
jgi:transketolase